MFPRLQTIACTVAALSVVALTSHAQTLYESNGNGGTVGAYNALTGAAINPNFISAGNDVGMALDPTSNIFYVAHGNNVGEYNATTGVPINPNFISLNNANGLALLGGILY